MIPYKDMNPTRRFPVMTYLLITVNVIVFFWELSFPVEELEKLFFSISVVPANFSADPFSAESFIDVVRSMFLHGGWFHLIGNMLYLYLFGDNVEDRFGSVLFLVLYFASGYAAAFLQVIIEPSSQIPLIGASGAISGVLGSYAVLYPGVEVRGIIPIGFFFYTISLPAWVFIGFWFLMQLLSGLATVSVIGESQGGVAFFAHIGGFIAGLFLTIIFLRLVPQIPARQRNEILYQRARRYWY